MSPRLRLASLPDDRLLAECDLDTYRASGPGGQKRNKTSSAVRLRHGATGLIVIAEESRSQHENKAKALRRLRQAFFLKLREPIVPESLALVDALRGDDGKLHAASAKDPRYWPALGVLLDAAESATGQIRAAAERMGVGTANFLSLFELDEKAWEQLAWIRRAAGLKPLRAGE